MDVPKNGKKHPLIVMAEKGKRVVAGILMVLMFVLLGIAVVELMWVPLTLVIPGLPGGTDSLLMSEAELLSIFGVFLSVLIALELVETVEVYFKDHEIHAEIVLLVALIALAQEGRPARPEQVRAAHHPRPGGALHRPCRSLHRDPLGEGNSARNATTASSPSSHPTTRRHV